jgi:hypothetical protein
MKARDWYCPFTGRPAEHLHHLTGCDAEGAYLDLLLVLPLLRRQHVIEHQCWSEEFADGVDTDPNVLRLRRSGHLFIRLGEHHAGGVVVLPAIAVAEMGRMLNRVADRIAGVLPTTADQAPSKR